MQFTYQTKTSNRAKNLTIRIDQSGEVIVTSPRFIPKFMINSFVSSKQSWIEAALAKIKFAKNQVAEDEVMLFGKNYKKTAFKYSNLERFIKNTAEKYIIPRTHQIADLMQIKFKRISLKQQKTCWGSCSRDGNLNFNWRLAHHPTKVIDYVIVHELSHRKHLNHSKEFWALVKDFDPQFKIHRNYLKRRGMVY